MKRYELPFVFDEPVQFIPFNKGDTLVMFDGDVLCFVACPPRDYLDKQKKRKDDFEVVTTQTFDMNGNCIDGLGVVDTQESLKPVPRKLPSEYTQEENERYLDTCWENLQNNIVSTRKLLGADGFLMAVKGDGNYRDDIFPIIKADDGTYTGYKANRMKNPEHRNLFVPKLRMMLVENGISIEADGRETDDFLRIWADEAEKAGDKFIIATIDKDLDMIPGVHFHLKKTVKYTTTGKYACRFYYEQLLKGDPTDNIPGLPGVGPKKAEAILDPYDTEHEFQAAVIDSYQEVMGDAWQQHLLANGKLLYLQKHINDVFTIRGWARFG